MKRTKTTALCLFLLLCLLPLMGLAEGEATLRIDAIVPIEGDAFGEMGEMGLFQKAEKLEVTDVLTGEPIAYEHLWIQSANTHYPVGVLGFFEIQAGEGEEPGYFFFPTDMQEPNSWIVGLDSRFEYPYTLIEDEDTLTLLMDGPAQAYRPNPEKEGEAYAFNLSIGTLVTMEDY